ncbi:hypothetical protein Pmani_027049 [Petrolisthes manimaculis]|uniref:Uncharacterized protein n=1 Tax=Petrolisthes manimaculis TaxID=1843537 RepID=A0AAE1P4Z2_9EUCA|nr:hypothetical protein Pmani_027049 [Petrolisthes manimaculis]
MVREARNKYSPVPTTKAKRYTYPRPLPAAVKHLNEKGESEAHDALIGKQNYLRPQDRRRQDRSYEST